MKNFRILPALVLFLAAFAPLESHARLKIDITKGNSDPVRIATPFFKGNDAQSEDVARKITQVIDGNLDRSGLFYVIPKESYLQNNLSLAAIPDFSSWQNIRTQALVIGSVESVGDGSLKVQFRLWDIATGKQTIAKSYKATPTGWRRIAHLASDEIYQYLTGETGYFDTRIVYVAESGDARKRTKRLAIMDQDGANQMFLTSGRNLVLTPRFDPNMQRLIYVSYRSRVPAINLYNLNTGTEEVLGQLPGMSFAPRFSPDGKKVIFSVSVNGATDIYEMVLSSKAMRKLTSSSGFINTSPSYSPDGSQIVFNSDRDGNQQLYVMNADGTNVRRISFGRGRYGTPVWSPRGDLIAFTKMRGGSFYIGVMSPDGSGERTLTESFLDEGPTWAPNGRVIIFTRESPSSAGSPGRSQLMSVDITGYNLRRIPTQTNASDPAWSPLLGKK
jgi:TolB protein